MVGLHIERCASPRPAEAMRLPGMARMEGSDLRWLRCDEPKCQNTIHQETARQRLVFHQVLKSQPPRSASVTDGERAPELK